MKRDYVQEISSRRSRISQRKGRFAEMITRRDGISAIATFVRTSKRKEVPFRNELAKYIPIGMVACIEGYFRLVFRDLIDYGSPFRENVANFRDIRIGIDHVVALQSRKVTLGEFIAHLLPASSLEDLNDSMSTLIGEPFLDRLKRTRVEYFDIGKPISLEEDGIAGDVFRDVKILFEQRHIFVHELATKSKVNPRRIAVDFAAGTILMFGTEALVFELTSGAT